MQNRNKQRRMHGLRRRASNSMECHRIVWGDGPLDAPVVFVGEAPGRREEEKGKPFVGPAGQLFDHELTNAGIDRAHVYVTNLIRCRLTSPGGSANRAPTDVEIATWLPFLVEEIEIIRPTVLVCLGAVAARALIGSDFRISTDRGKWFSLPICEHTMATFHPSYVRRIALGKKRERLDLFRKDLAQAKRLAGNFSGDSRRDEQWSRRHGQMGCS